VHILGVTRSANRGKEKSNFFLLSLRFRWFSIGSFYFLLRFPHPPSYILSLEKKTSLQKEVEETFSREKQNFRICLENNAIKLLFLLARLLASDRDWSAFVQPHISSRSFDVIRSLTAT